MKQVRHYQRYTVTGSGFIHHIPIKNAEFHINNISASGMNITSAVDLMVNQVITLEVHVSGNILPYSKLIKGKVIRKIKHCTIYYYGVQFIELAHNDIVEIDEYLRLNYSSTALYLNSYNTGEDTPIKQLQRKNDY